MTVRVHVTLLAGDEALAASDFYLDLQDVPQRLSMAEIVAAVVQAANIKAQGNVGLPRSAHQQAETIDEARASEMQSTTSSRHERKARDAFRRDGFPFAVSDGRGRVWMETRLEHAVVGELPCGGSRTPLSRLAVGSLLRHGTGEAGRLLDGPLGAPGLAEARRLLELRLSLRKFFPGEGKPKGANGGAGHAGSASASTGEGTSSGVDGRGRGRGGSVLGTGRGSGRKRKAGAPL